MKNITFTSLDDLFAFLLACEEGEALGARRDTTLYEWVKVQSAGPGGKDSGYGIEFDETHWNVAGHHFGGRIAAGAAPGARVHLNDVFHSILLCRDPQPRLAGDSVVLAIPRAPTDADEESLRNQLFAATRRLRKLAGAESRYFLTNVGANSSAGPEWLAGVAITDLDPSQFDYAQFEQLQCGQPEDRKVKLFLPAWTEGHCFLFVEWGCRYPKPEEFRRLYNERRLAHGTPTLLMSRGESLGGEGKVTWYAPLWHWIAPESYRTEFHPYGPMQATLQPLAEATVASGEPPALELQVGSVADTVGDTGGLERSIGAAERELEWLYARRNRLRLAAQLDYYPLYVWGTHQPPGGGPLPAGLQEFLGRAHGELAQYRYLAVEWPNGAYTTRHFPQQEPQSAPPRFWHCILGLTRATRSACLAVACDQCYLQEARWQEWGLPLFVHYQDALKPGLDEQAAANRVLELLEAQGVRVGPHLLLTEPAATNGPPTSMELLLLPAADAKDLEAHLKYIGAAGPGAGQAARRAQKFNLPLVQHHPVAALPEAEAFSRAVLGRAGELLRELQKDWEQLRTDSQAVRLQMALTQVALEITRKANHQQPQTWREFLDQALLADEQLAQMKVAALQHWAKDKNARDEEVGKLKERHGQVAPLVTARKKEFDSAAALMEGQLVELQKQLEAVAAARQKALEKHQELQARRADLQKQLMELESTLAPVRRDLEQLKNDCAALTRKRAEHERLGRLAAEARVEKARREEELRKLGPLPAVPSSGRPTEQSFWDKLMFWRRR